MTVTETSRPAHTASRAAMSAALRRARAMSETLAEFLASWHLLGIPLGPGAPVKGL